MAPSSCPVARATAVAEAQPVNAMPATHGSATAIAPEINIFTVTTARQ